MNDFLRKYIGKSWLPKDQTTRQFTNWENCQISTASHELVLSGLIHEEACVLLPTFQVQWHCVNRLEISPGGNIYNGNKGNAITENFLFFLKNHLLNIYHQHSNYVVLTNLSQMTWLKLLRSSHFSYLKKSQRRVGVSSNLCLTSLILILKQMQKDAESFGQIFLLYITVKQNQCKISKENSIHHQLIHQSQLGCIPRDNGGL